MTATLDRRLRAIQRLHAPTPHKRNPRCKECGFAHPCLSYRIASGQEAIA